MKLRWLAAAAAALDREYDYLSERNPLAAKRAVFAG
jgi:plasmid stabilization system protein ParE